MSHLYERIKNEAERAIMRDAEPTNLKGCTVRLIPEYIQLIDKLAEQLGESRQTFLSALIYDAVEEALNAYASVFDDSSKVYSEMKDSCGFVYGTGRSQFLDFCSLNNYDPADPESMSNFEMVVDHMKEKSE